MMRHSFRRMVLSIVLSLGLCATLAWAAPSATQNTSSPTQSIVLAGGCFWGMESVFEHVKGVQSAVAGYTGGNADTANYETVSTGTTGHAESVKVTYDPSVIPTDQLLNIYFTAAHNPTELNYQGPDHGTQYRSEIFYTTPEQRDAAKATMAKLEQDKIFTDPIVTTMQPLTRFYPAEDYHQRYAELHPNNPYILFNDVPLVHHVKEQYPNFYQNPRS